MKILTAITTSIILLSPFAANAYDADELFQECVKDSFSNLHRFLDYNYKICQDKTDCPLLQRDLGNIQRVWAPGDSIFSEIRLDYDASTITRWGDSVGLNETNTRELIIRTVNKCGISF